MYDMLRGYLDESGDGGSSLGSSKCLVLSLLLTKSEDALKKIDIIIQNLKTGLRKSKKGINYLKRKGEIKFDSFPDEELLFNALRQVAEQDIKIIAVVFDKCDKKVNSGDKEEIIKQLLTYLFMHFISKNVGWGDQLLKAYLNEPKATYAFVDQVLMFGKKYNFNKITADLGFFGKRSQDIYYALKKGKETNVSFVLSGLEIKLPLFFEKISQEKYYEIKDSSDCLAIRVEHKQSSGNNKLQMVDLIAGAIFQKFEHKDSRFFDLIEKKTSIKKIG